MPDLLIELFSEEIPARMQARAAEDLKRMVTDGLVEAGLTYASAGAFHTPRRLALSVEGLSEASRDTVEERKGPRTDAPEKALEGFLRSTGLTMDQLEIRDEKKGQAYFAKITHKGRPAEEIVAEVLEGAIRNFPWPKSMRWGAGDLRWVRPLHSILCLLSDEQGARVVPMEIDGIAAGDVTRGHRFMGPDEFTVSSFEDYEAKLKRGCVLLRAEERAETIWSEASSQAFAQGLELVEDRGLLDEVAGLVEWPVVLMGEIGDEFLDLPPEVLQTSMKEHQKFFSVRDPKSGKITRFVTVANIETRDHGATILAGNGKVLAARLSDAKFFWENDLRVVKEGGLEAMGEGLSNVTFHNRLGSQSDRVARIAALAREIAPRVSADADDAERAAKVAKADLRSEMVGEFPELQGLMGRYYAEAQGLSPAIAAAAQEHYQPLGPSDDVPSAPVSVAVALADKLDTLAGFWAIEEKPTGSKDPFALRRAALGVIRLVLSNGLRLQLRELIAKADGHAEVEDLLSFFHDRLKVHLRAEGIPHDVIDACIAMPGNDDLTLLVARAEALAGFLKTEDGENLTQGFKRANNILTQAEQKDGVEYSFGADAKFAEGSEEKALFAALDGAQPKIDAAMASEDFASAMAAMASLRAPIDAFFEAVQVNTENQVLRRNRLNLLSRIRTTCGSVADLSKIEG
ncbi:glycyl-tRNA synthetase beta chain [Limimaricola soesokkakensis]|uniref:Glycine--tRNA ligase beta subunit n=1 Tax=Limimaricola soesokkakensis TaxID=1343159 RepID=A0A1X6YAG9_9RHOB|nr:glycine--tRNA ligase subunit beta [Limimaricola soesokkakensis]PSK87152.1 glycyl-tRNA synthetase beta chain [Limimaricola soesokkakensis]SLN15363.1 Glycine--tRNA ligase beta subunit [Limimaricola soesokkakensis]